MGRIRSHSMNTPRVAFAKTEISFFLAGNGFLSARIGVLAVYHACGIQDTTNPFHRTRFDIINPTLIACSEYVMRETKPRRKCSRLQVTALHGCTVVEYGASPTRI